MFDLNDIMISTVFNKNMDSFSVDAIFDTINKMKNIPKPEYDGFAFTYHEWDKIRKGLQPSFMSEYDKKYLFIYPDKLLGLPVYLYTDKLDCVAFAIRERMENNRKICILKDE